MSAFTLPSHAEMVANILATFAQATPEQAIDGATWYAQAHAIAGELMPDDIEKGAAILAVLSPALSWDKNIAAAIAASRRNGRRPAGVIGTNWQKARDIRRVRSDVDSLVRGAKVRAFWRCIATNGTDTHAVCVDRHAAAIACGYFLDSADSGRAVAGKRYDALADAYRDAAAIADVPPATMQAVTWVVWRATPWRDRPSA